MFVFAASLTGTCWVYWKLHVAPFLPLQQLLADEFEDCRPQVQGGQRKIHKGTPQVLRVTMKIDFDPRGTQGKAHADEFAAQVVEVISQKWPPLFDYQTLELHFYWPEPEKEIVQQKREFPVAELQKSRG